MSVGRRPPPLTSAQRTTRAGIRSRQQGAVNQFLSPELSGAQGGVLKGIRAKAGVAGLFGGAVNNAVDRTNTKFIAGNRLSGLEGILAGTVGAQDVVGGSRIRDDVTEIQGILNQVQGLREQFNFGGQAGLEAVANLDPGTIGAFTRNEDVDSVRLNRGRGGINAFRPGTAANDLARRFAESQGAVDTNQFIRENPDQIRRAISFGVGAGFDTPQSAVGQDLVGGTDTAPEDFQRVIFDFIQTQRTAKGDILNRDRGRELVRGAGNLNNVGLLPFLPFAGNTPNEIASRTGGARELFSPLLFGSGR